MNYLEFAFLKLTTLFVVLNLLSLLVTCDSNYGNVKTIAASTGRAFEYDSFPTNHDEIASQNTKGFGVPRIVSHNSAPTSQIQAATPSPVGSEMDNKKQEVTNIPKDTKDGIDVDDRQTEDKKQLQQPISLYSAMKLIGQEAVKQYQVGHNTNSGESRIIKGFGFGGGGWKLGK